MYTPIGDIQKRSPNRLPNAPVSREHPKDSSFLHRNGRVDKVTGVRTGENIKKQRHAIAGMRSKLACAASSAKTQRFVHTNKPIDHAIDNPVQLSQPAARGTCKGRGGRSGGLARTLRVA